MLANMYNIRDISYLSKNRILYSIRFTNFMMLIFVIYINNVIKNNFFVGSVMFMEIMFAVMGWNCKTSFRLSNLTFVNGGYFICIYIHYIRYNVVSQHFKIIKL